jgi:hypothetical protein
MGPRWWLASDGNWYPPEPEPGAPTESTPTADDPSAAPDPSSHPARRRWSWLQHVNVGLLAIVVASTIALAAIAAAETMAGSDHDLVPVAFVPPTIAAASTTTTTAAPTTTTLPPTTLPYEDGVQPHIPADVNITCQIHLGDITGSVVDAASCRGTSADAPTTAAYFLLSTTEDVDSFYSAYLAKHDIPPGECGDAAPRECTYTGGTQNVTGRFADYVDSGAGCRVWIDGELPIMAVACRDDGSLADLNTWWQNAGPS